MRASSAPKKAVFSRKSINLSASLQSAQRQIINAKMRAQAVAHCANFFIVVGVLFGAAIVVAVVAFFHFVANVDYR